MSRHSFSKTTVSNISKFLLDKSFFYFISTILFIFCCIKNFITYYSWEKNFLSYFTHDIKISNIPSLNIYDFFILVLINFISLIIPTIVIRFCIGILLIKSQIKVQRFFTIITILFFILSTNFTGFYFGKSHNISYIITKISDFINMSFIAFLIISLMIFFININENIYKKKIRIIVLLISVVSFLIYDWKNTEKFRVLSKENIEKTNILFIIENNQKENLFSLKSTNEYKYLEKNFKLSSSEISLVSNFKTANYSSLFTTLFPFESGIRNDIPNDSYFNALENHIKKNRITQKEISISNISNPSSFAALSKYFDTGIKCDNNINKIKKYNYLQNLNPIILFLPYSILIKFIPDTLCLSSYNDLSNLILDEFYLRLNQTSIKDKNIISIIPENFNPINLFKIIEKINETLESKNLEISILFMQPEKKSQLLQLSKKQNPELKFKNIINISNHFFSNYKQEYEFNYFEENLFFKNTIQSKIIENRVSLNLTENIEQVFNIKRDYICLQDEQETEILHFEKLTNEIPQKINIIKKNVNNNCEIQVEKSFTNDVNFLIDKNLFNKIFIFSMEKT